MDDRRQIPRASGLPRPASRLPVFSSQPGAASSSSTIPGPAAPTSAPPVRGIPLRAKPSRESLSGGDLRNPKLRAIPSRDRLRAGSPSSSTGPPIGVGGSLAVAKNQARNVSSPRTRAVSGEFARPPPRSRASIGVPPLPSSRLADDLTVKRPGTSGGPSRRASAQHLSRPNQAYSPTPDDDTIDEEGNYAPGSSLRPKASRSRLSLAERTMETLAQIPSSPAVKGRTSSFYEPESASLSQSQRPGSRNSRPPSRTGRPGSRPGSGLGHSDMTSSRSTSRPASRPASRPTSRPASRGRAGSVHDSSVPDFRTSVNALRPGLPSFLPIDEVSSPATTPKPNRTLRARASLGPGPVVGQRYSYAAGGLRQPDGATPHARTPSSPDKLDAMPATTPARAAPSSVTANMGSKMGAPRPLKPRGSLSNLMRKTSHQPLVDTAATAATRQSSLASRASSTSYEDNSGSIASTVSTAVSSIDVTDPGSPGTAYRKSSAALREQIAKAKAAKRAAAQQVSSISSSDALAEETTATAPAPTSYNTSTFGSSFGFATEAVVPTDTTFDFGLDSDPFNQNRSSQNQAKVVQARLALARSSGRLNIAALNLREIPAEVLDMYDSAALGTDDGSWAEAVDLTRFVAADNEIEMIDDSVFPDRTLEELADDEDSKGNIFAGLETLDLHGNMLISLPMGLRQLQVLTSLNLSQNRITNNAFKVISQITSLRDLKLGGNLFYGPLDPCFAKLVNLEIADLHGNNITALPVTMSNMTKLRILNISENNFESLVFEPLSKIPLTELNVRKNKLSGTLIEDVVTSMPRLHILDVSANQIAHFVSDNRTTPLALPAIQQLHVGMNRLQSLPDMSDWSTLITLIGEENSINSIPDGFARLRSLRHADFSSNDIRLIPPEIGRMDKLTMLRLSGNPLRDKRFCTADTDEIKDVLLSRLGPDDDAIAATEMQDELRDAVGELATTGAHGRTRSRKLSSASATGRGDESEDDFATPPTSLPTSPARSRAHTLTGQQLWPVKAGGVLDRSETESSSLHPVISSQIALENNIYDIRLNTNFFTAFPDSLSFFAATLTTLSLAKNQLKGEDYLGDAGLSDGLDLPVLKELNLSSNHITGLGPLVRHVRAPSLQKLDVSMNRVSALPPDTQLRDAFPELTVLLASNNHLADLNPDSIRGMRVVDVSNNDIDHLNPRLGLLGGEGGLQRFEVLGNRFRVPRFNVIERGTDATLRWLRGRVPVAEMGAWRDANRQAGCDPDDDLD